MAVGSISDAFETFEEDNNERPMAMVIVGENGAERVWLDSGIETFAQIEWAVRHIRAAASSAQRMEKGIGRA